MIDLVKISSLLIYHELTIIVNRARYANKFIIRIFNNDFMISKTISDRHKAHYLMEETLSLVEAAVHKHIAPEEIRSYKYIGGSGARRTY